MATAKTSDPFKSPYRSIENSMLEYFKQWAQNTIHPSEVAKVILQVATDNDDFNIKLLESIKSDVKIIIFSKALYT
jgi:hypothetical protein